MALVRWNLKITNVVNKSIVCAQAMWSALSCSLGAERRGEQLVRTM